MKITTTTKKFREGVKLSGAKGDEVRWESTGHLSVRLLDAWGVHPVAKRKVNVDIPGEGKVELESDDDGKIFHPDVPFQDYELDLGDKVKVHAPAVGIARTCKSATSPTSRTRTGAPSAWSSRRRSQRPARTT